MCDLSKRLTGRALAPPVFAKVQSQQRERPDSSIDKTTITFELDFGVMAEKQPVAARVGRSTIQGAGSPRAARGPAHWSTDKTTTSYTLDFRRTANHEQTTTADRELLTMLAVSRLLACSQVSTATVHQRVAHTRSDVRARYFTVTANKRCSTQYKCRDVFSLSELEYLSTLRSSIRDSLPTQTLFSLHLHLSRVTAARRGASWTLSIPLTLIKATILHFMAGVKGPHRTIT